MTEEMHLKTNPDVLKWARESIALTKLKAVESLRISLSRLDQLENGEKYPSMDDLRAMSKTYSRTIAALLLQQPPQEKPLPRDRRTINSSQLDVFDEKTIMTVRKARALVNSLIELREEAELNILSFKHKATLKDSAEALSEKFLKEWSIDEYRNIKDINVALESYIELIESFGIAVFQLSLTKDNLRGFSLIDEQIPVIVIKRGGEFTHSKIFTLFHELGHILLNEGGLCDTVIKPSSQEIEKWCNAFAAGILIPSDVLLNLEKVNEYKAINKSNWSKSDLIEIGDFFHVGPLAILRRLLDHGLTTNEFYNERHKMWNKSSFGRSKHPEGKNIPKETIKQFGKTYVNLAFKAYDQNKIDLKELSDFLGIKLSHLPKTRQLLTSL